MKKLHKIFKYWFRFTLILNILSWISGLTSNLKEDKEKIGWDFSDLY